MIGELLLMLKGHSRSHVTRKPHLYGLWTKSYWENSLCKNGKRITLATGSTSLGSTEKNTWLTFTLDKVKVELVEGRHGDTAHLVVGEERLHAMGDVFTRWHTRCLGHLLLQHILCSTHFHEDYDLKYYEKSITFTHWSIDYIYLHKGVMSVIMTASVQLV